MNYFVFLSIYNTIKKPSTIKSLVTLWPLLREVVYLKSRYSTYVPVHADKNFIMKYRGLI